MSVDFKTSETAKNLMRAFAGESQARNRYTFAADAARKQNLHVIDAVFTFTAHQERAHAKIFYNHLRELSPQTITIDAGYPAEACDDVLKLLQMSAHNEFEEHDPIYKAFADTASKEGFAPIASSFAMIAEIEKTHGDRFKTLADLLEQNKLFVSDCETGWMCLNCGHIYKGVAAPAQCPVCSHDKGFFIRLSLAPYQC